MTSAICFVWLPGSAIRSRGNHINCAPLKRSDVRQPIILALKQGCGQLLFCDSEGDLD
jgi:hypothetical protein